MKMLQIIDKRIDELNDNYNEVYNYFLEEYESSIQAEYEGELYDIRLLIDELLDLKQEYLKEVTKDETNN